jgi:CRISPR associated protein Cas2
MALYFISYDLRKQQDYQPLYNELKKLQAVKIMESTFCLNMHNTSCTMLMDHFKEFIDFEDGLMVHAVANWASRFMKRTPNDLAKLK